MLAADPSAQEIFLLPELGEQAATFVAETGGQPGVAWRRAERDPGRGTLLPDDVIDQAVDAIARHFGAAAVLAGDCLQHRDQGT